MKVLFRWLGLLIVVLSVVSTIFYFMFGISKFVEVRSHINTLNNEYKTGAINQLDNRRSTKIFSGIFAQKLSTNKKIGGIWLLDNNGIRYFNINNETLLSKFSLCKDEKWKSPSANVSKNTQMSYIEWASDLRQGDYVQVVMSPKGRGEVAEVIIYDWWAFAHQIPFNFFEKRCSN